MISNYIKDDYIKSLVELVEKIQNDFRYPNSEGESDKIRYAQRFETEFNALLDEFRYGQSVTRLEVIDNNGRSYTNWKVEDLELSLQDQGRTLKIFARKRND